MTQARTASRILDSLARTSPDDRDPITIGELLDELGDRSLGSLMLLFALPNLVPIPLLPGSTTLTGIPLICLSLQLAMGRNSLWLPGFVTRATVKRSSVRAWAARIGRLVAPLEAVAHPRAARLVSPAWQCIAGWVSLLMSVILSLPIPLGNFLPALSLALVAIGLIESDGAFVTLGLATALVAGGVLLVLGEVIHAFFCAIW